MAHKTCTNCKEEKPQTPEYFNRRSAVKDGLSSWCKDCTKSSYKDWQEENKPYLKKKWKEHRESNRERRLEQRRVWYKRYTKYAKDYQKRYARLHKSSVNAKNSSRKAKKIEATPAWANQEEIKYIYSLAQEKSLEVDHIVPLKSGDVCGLHCEDNLRCIPSELNMYKGNRYWPDMWSN